MKDSSYRTCADGAEIEAWLVTKTLNMNQTLYDVELHIEIESQIEKCDGIDGICFKDGFELFRYKGEGEPIIPSYANKPNANVEKLKTKVYLQDNFSFMGNITGNSTSKERVNTTFTLNLKEFRGITFGIKSRGGCGSVIRMKVYYVVCKEIFIKNVMFVKTMAPQNGTKVVFGNCSANTTLDSRTGGLRAFCHSNGSWTTEGEMVCTCDKGYESTDKGCMGMFCYIKLHVVTFQLKQIVRRFDVNVFSRRDDTYLHIA